MKIGIIVHSLTGNTLLVAEKVKERLSADGHVAVIERVKVAGVEDPNNRSFTLENPPDPAPYDALVFGAPVRGFALSPVMAAYLNQMTAQASKKAAAFVTEFFPFDWMGGRNSVVKMSGLAKDKGIDISKSFIIHWKSGGRDKSVKELIESISGLFSRT